MAERYVKFLRGTPAAYEIVQNKNEDTLYFICEKDAAEGKLYLGSKLISSGVSSGSVASIGEIANVDVSGAANGQVLGYDAANQKWVPITLPNGAPVLVDGKSLESAEDGTVSLQDFGKKFYEYNPETEQYTLVEVSDEKPWPAGLEPRITPEGNIGWYEPETNAAELAKKVASLEALLSSQDHLKRKIVANFSEIDLTAEDRDSYIYMVPTGKEGDDKYDEYIIVNDAIEKVGSWTVDLSDYVTKEEFNDTVGDLATLLGEQTLSEKIVEIEKSIKWEEMEEDVNG